MRIFGIGGGDFLNRKTKMLDDILISLVKKEPNVLYIPTASKDNNAKSEAFKKIYEEEYSAKVDILYLNNKTKKIEERILASDLIYVAGGNTEYMINTWKKYQVDEYLIKAYKKNILLSGISAGAICWFKYAYTDYKAYNYNGYYYNFTFTDGLNIIPLCCCPHYDEDGHEAFNDDVIDYGLGLENETAFYYENGTIKVITSNKKSVYLVKKDGIREIKSNELIIIDDLI